jgi:hypothetical protein
MRKAPWVTPVLVRKPVSETAQGLGKDVDGLQGELPIQSGGRGG